MIVDHRTYTLKPGGLAEYLAKYEEMGLKVQIKHLGRLAGYWFTEIGPLNQIVHVWAYENLAERDERRGKMQADPAWQAWIKVSSQYFVSMENKILKEAPFFKTRFMTPDG
ncbi:MAG: NIPSNAP family protein [Alphaproteobacteria bacterium]|nr:NIPSNAP family protein [Alphaproteobacteria bacterium]